MTMKRKVTRIRRVNGLNAKLKGMHVFRVSGPCAVTGVKVTREFTGTRKQAETVKLYAPGVNGVSHG